MKTSRILLTALVFASNAVAQQPPVDDLLTAARNTYTAVRAGFGAGTEDLDTVYRWSLRWMEAEQPINRARAAQAHRARMQDTCSAATRMIEAGTLRAHTRSACAYYLAHAEVLVQR